MVTDGEGKIRFNGFLGEYTLSWAGKETAFYLDEKGITTAEASF